MNKKKSIWFQLLIIAFIIIIVRFSAILNAYAFRSSCVEAGGENSASILAYITERIEYGLRYGRELNNYYDIERIFDDIKEDCGAEACYIIDTDRNLLYGESLPKNLEDEVEELEVSGSKQILWESKGMQHILLAIEANGETEGYIGIWYSVDKMNEISDSYVKSLSIYFWIAALVGALLFIILFHVIKHEYNTKRLRFMIMGVLIFVSIMTVTASFFVLKAGYQELSRDMAEQLLDQCAGNIERLLGQGVYYSDIQDTDEYFKRITDASEQVQTIALTDGTGSGEITRILSPDEEGVFRYLQANVSQEYISYKVRRAILNVVVTTLSAIMIAMEILIFLMDLLNDDTRDRRKKRNNDAHVTIEHLGIVRGLSFFFASFRFMAVAFMSIVLAEIYRPVYIFGYQIPYEILMSIPLSSQVFISMITSYLSGRIISKKGWKMPTLIGVMIMIGGTTASAIASEPITFILAQMLLGTGLGFAKMGIDIYAVSVSSETDMSTYTSSSNAAIIVGYSCSASIGALIASIFGYSGAYIVMTIIGLLVLIWLYIFGMDVEAQKEEPEEVDGGEVAVTGRDLRFPIYLLFVIVPYFFIMMFVDYFFPVYANSVNVTTDTIGYVMLIYGIVTAYVGTPLCPKLSQRFPAYILMPVILIILGGGFLIFSVHNALIFAVLIVVLIGIADGIMPSIQFQYVYDLPYAKKIGFSRALGIEGFFSNLIGAVAPVIFGVVMLYGNGGLGLIAILIIVCSVLFLMMNRIFESKKKRASEVEK